MEQKWIMQSCWYGFFYMLLLRNFFELHRMAGKKGGIKQSKIGQCNWTATKQASSSSGPIWYHLRHCYSRSIPFFFSLCPAKAKTLINLLYFITFTRIIFTFFAFDRIFVRRVSSWLRQMINSRDGDKIPEYCVCAFRFKRENCIMTMD